MTIRRKLRMGNTVDGRLEDQTHELGERAENRTRAEKEKRARSFDRALKTPAASYSPTKLPLQYHRPWRA